MYKLPDSTHRTPSLTILYTCSVGYAVRPSLAGRVALITGASSGIGEATAHVFAGAGAKLVLNGRDAKKLDAVVAAIKQHTPSAQIVTQIGSVDKEETHVQLVTLAINRFGALHVAFNNAGVFTFVDLKGSTAANVSVRRPTQRAITQHCVLTLANVPLCCIIRRSTPRSISTSRAWCMLSSTNYQLSVSLPRPRSGE